MIRTFKKALENVEFNKTSYIEVEDGFYCETIVDDGSGFPSSKGWYETYGDEEFVQGLLEMGYKEL